MAATVGATLGHRRLSRWRATTNLQALKPGAHTLDLEPLDQESEILSVDARGVQRGGAQRWRQPNAILPQVKQGGG